MNLKDLEVIMSSPAGNSTSEQIGKTTFYEHGTKFYSAGKMDSKKADTFISQVAKKNSIGLTESDYPIIRGHIDQTRINMGKGLKAFGGGFANLAKGLASSKS